MLDSRSEIQNGLTTSQAAHLLGVSSERVRQLMAQGRLEHVRTPLGAILDPRSVEDWRAIRTREVTHRGQR